MFDLYGTLIQLDRDTSPDLWFARLVRPDDHRAVVLRSFLANTCGIGVFAVRLAVPPPSEVAGLEADLHRNYNPPVPSMMRPRPWQGCAASH